LIPAAADDPRAELVAVQFGEVPIILSAPHGGRSEVPGVAERTGSGVDESPGRFVVLRDAGTEELLWEVARAIERRWGGRPYVVAARFHRRFIDVNRPPEVAYEDPDAEPIYRAYHEALSACCREVQSRHRTGLLLDLHGQSASAGTVYRGTQNGQTTQLLLQRFGSEALTGSAGLSACLQRQGWKLHPDPLGDPEAPSYRGGYIVRTYGSPDRGIDAVQLEFGSDYRRISQRSRVARELASALAEYAQDYLEFPLPASAVRPPSPLRAVPGPRPPAK
jgi:N-formylglutamate amidohydrolase